MGRGLGLAVAYSIIKNHRGLLTVEAVTGPGAEFHIYLPLSGTRSDGEKPLGTNEIASGRKILFMDDQENVRKVAVKMLKNLGYEAVPVADGREAIESYREAAESARPFAAVVLDLTVPGGMGGVMAAARIRELDPGARLIVSSGYSDDPVLADYQSYGFVGKIAKPYEIENIRAALAEVLGDPGPAKAGSTGGPPVQARDRKKENDRNDYGRNIDNEIFIHSFDCISSLHVLRDRPGGSGERRAGPDRLDRSPPGNAALWAGGGDGGRL